MSATKPPKITAAAKPAKPGKDTIYVDVDDDITAIIDKVEAAKEKIVALVLPKRTTTLQSVVNMRLLKRSADKATKNVVLITTEAALLPLAGAAGLHVARNLQSSPEIPESPLGVTPEPEPKVESIADEQPEAEDMDSDKPAKIDYLKPVGALAAAKALDDEPETIDLEDTPAVAADTATPAVAKAAKDKKLKVPNFDRFRLMVGLGIAALVALIVFIILAVFILPKATINVQTTSQPVSANFNLTTSDKATALDETKKIIPAVSKTSDQSATQQVTATGQQNNGQKATGTATLTNCGSSAVTVPAGTGVSANGLTYITQKSVDLDSGNFDSHGNCKTSGSHVGSTGITAQQGGAKYNTSLSGATVSGFSGVTASGSASGGTDNNVTILSQSDVDNAKNKLTSGSTADDFTKKFEADLSNQGYYVVTSTLKAGDPVINASPAVGQPASTANVSIKVTYSVLAVKKDDLSKIITDTLKQQFDNKTQKVSTDDVLKGATVTVTNQSAPAVATLAVSESTTAVPILDVESIKNQIKGQKAGDIKSAINNINGVKNVDVHFSPFWVSKAPKKTSKIIIVQQQVSDGNSSP